MHDVVVGVVFIVIVFLVEDVVCFFVAGGLATVMSLPASEPVYYDDGDDDAVDGGDVVHVLEDGRLVEDLWEKGGRKGYCGLDWTGLTARNDGHGRREAVHDQSKESPSEENVIGDEADGAHPEGAVGNVVAAFEEEADDGDGVGYVEEDDAGRYHARWEGC